MSTAPDLAAAAAQSSQDPNQVAQNAQILAGGQQAAAAQGIQEHAQHHDWLHSLDSWMFHAETNVWNDVPFHKQAASVAQAALTAVDKPISTVADWANKPFQDITHQYRYVRDMFANHGWEKGMVAFLTPAPNHIDSMPLTNGSLQQEVWNRTGAPDYRLNNDLVSPGRDAAGMILGTHHGPAFTAVSGLLDAAFNLTADPTLGAGKIFKATRTAATVLHGVEDFAPVMDAAMKRGPLVDPIARAVNDITSTSSATQIAERYPTLRYLPPNYRQALADSTTNEQTVQVLHDALIDGKLGTHGLPIYSFTRIPLRAAGDAMKNWQLDRGAVDDLVTTSGVNRADATAMQQINDRVARTVNAFGNHIPFTVDPKSADITTQRFADDDPRAADALYAFTRYGNSATVARSLADQFTAAQAAGDGATQRLLWKNAKIASTIGRGVPDTPQMRASFDEGEDALHQRTGVHDNAIYGNDEKQTDVSKVWIDKGDGQQVQVSAPLFSSQMGYLHPLDLQELNLATRENGWGSRFAAVRKLGAMYGHADENTYKYLMSPTYRTMLVTGGFPVRNAMSGEMLPRIIGEDGVKLLATAARKAVVKAIAHGDILTENAAADRALAAKGIEPTHSNAFQKMSQAVTIAMGQSFDKAHLDKLTGNPQMRDDIAEFIMDNHGETATPGALAGETGKSWMGDTSAVHAGNLRSRMSVTGGRLNPDKFVQYTRSDGIKPMSRALSAHAGLIAADEGARLQAERMLAALGDTGKGAAKEFSDEQLRAAEAASNQAGHDWLTSDSTEAKRTVGGIIRKTAMSSKDGTDPLIDWAVQRTQAIKGATFDHTGQPNLDLLRGIAFHDNSEYRKMLQPNEIHAMGMDRIPLAVPGMETVPEAPRGIVKAATEAGFNKVISPIINRLSRETIFQSHYHDELNLARSLPNVTPEEAKLIASQRAVERMIPEIHNPLDRSQFQIWARNLIPFWFAKEQSYRRLARAMRENPLGFRQIQLANHALTNTGFTQQDPQTGKTTFNYPMSGEIGRFLPWALSHMGIDTTMAVSTSIGGAVQGLYPGGEDPNSPARVGVSPLVNFAMDGLKTAFPESTAVANWVTGPIAADQPLWQQILPNAGIRDAAQMFLGERDKTFANAMAQAVQAAIANGDVPPGDAAQGSPAWDTWMGRIRNYTRINFALRMLYGIGAPASPILRIGDQMLSPEFQADIAKYGITKGSQEFQKAHPDATSYEIFKSQSAGGTSIPETVKAWNWVTANMDFVRKNGAAASFFIPQMAAGDSTSLAVYNDQLAAGLRSRKAPDALTKEIMVQRGWNLYEAANTTQKAALLAAANDPNQTSILKKNFKDYIDNQLARTNRLWFEDYNAQAVRKGDKQLLIKQVYDLLQSGKVPESPMTPIITSLMGDYRNYQQAVAGVGNPMSASYGTSTATDLTTNWNNYLAQVELSNPTAASAISRLFKGA
jgi:hypothetical protein